MKYDCQCHACQRVFEVECPVGERDAQTCPECDEQMDRIFRPAQICLPERFKSSMASLTPTYQEIAAQDKRNEDYLNQKKEPAKPSFEDCLEKACVENRVDPGKLQTYALKEMLPGG